MEFVEMFKAPITMLHPLLTATFFTILGLLDAVGGRRRRFAAGNYRELQRITDNYETVFFVLSFSDGAARSILAIAAG